MPRFRCTNGTPIPDNRKTCILRTALELARVQDLDAAQIYLHINAVSADLYEQFRSAFATQETSVHRTTLTTRLQTCLRELPLPMSCINTLHYEGKHVVQDILCDNSTLLCIPNIGPFTLDQLDTCLKSIGIERHANGSHTDLWAHPTEDSPSSGAMR
ncbi:MAG: hypothetical protein WCX29_03315 [Candidatus Peribacteraceae bacterium]